MTTQNPHGSSDNETADLVRSVAISSARLWEEVLERLVRVERSQAELTQTLARLQSALPTGSVTPELSSASNVTHGLPAAALPPPPLRSSSPIEVNGLEVNGRQPSLGSAPDRHVDAEPSSTAPNDSVDVPSLPEPPAFSPPTPILDLAGTAGPDLDTSVFSQSNGPTAPVAWDVAPAAQASVERAPTDQNAAPPPPPPPPGFSGSGGAFPPPPQQDFPFAPPESPGDFLAEGPGEPVEAPRSRKFSLRRKSSKKAAAAAGDPIAESMADSILAAAEGGQPALEAAPQGMTDVSAPSLADLPPPPADFAPTFTSDPSTPVAWSGVAEITPTAPDPAAFGGLHAVQPAANPSPAHPAFGGPDPALAPVEAEEPRWTPPAPPEPAWTVTPPSAEPAWSLTPPPPAAAAEPTWAPAPPAASAPPPPPMAPVPPTVRADVPESPFVSQPPVAPPPVGPSPFVQPSEAPSPFVQPVVAQAPEAPAPATQAPVGPSPFVQPSEAPSPFVQPSEAPSPFVQPVVAQAPEAPAPATQAPVGPSPFVQPPAAPAGFSLEDLQGEGAIGAPLPPVAAPAAPEGQPPAAPAGFSLEDLQGEGAIGAPLPSVAAPAAAGIPAPVAAPPMPPPMPPPPPPGFANQPASIESLGLDPDPAPAWEGTAGFPAAPAAEFAQHQGTAEPPAPPFGFDRSDEEDRFSAPPPPAGFSTADFSGTGAIGGSVAEATTAAPSPATLMGGEVPEPPITPDFFARAGRKRR